VHLREHVPLAPYTTIGLGGPARFFAECATEEDLEEALSFAKRRRLPVLVMGGGSNLIVPDAGFPGLVVRVALGGVAFQDRGDALELSAGAGVPWDDVVAESVRRGVSGIECLSGIPGTVGGTPIQNVGAYGQEIAESLVRVTCLARDTLERVRFERADCGFGYRTSRFKREDRDRFIVLEVVLRLRPGARPRLAYQELAAAVAERADLAQLAPGEAIRLVRETVLALRRRKSMVLDPRDPESRSVGSFFLNPVLSAEAVAELERRWRALGGSDPVPTFPAPGGLKVPAAWLVERAGFPRGYEADGVGISRRHALALVNRGGTTAQLLALAAAIERRVEERFGIRLEREPVVVEAG
jgi:UDP-N-acetylmuramate dehydrogenase